MTDSTADFMLQNAVEVVVPMHMTHISRSPSLCSPVGIIIVRDGSEASVGGPQPSRQHPFRVVNTLGGPLAAPRSRWTTFLFWVVWPRIAPPTRWAHRRGDMVGCLTLASYGKMVGTAGLNRLQAHCK